MIDGEIVAVDKCGAAHYSSSASIRHSKRFTTDLRTPIVFYAFDLLHLNGRDLTQRPLEERRAAERLHHSSRPA